MNTEERKTELNQLAAKVLSLPQYSQEFEHLFSELSITQEEVIRAFITWDLDPDAYGNEFYDSIPVRFAMHLKNRAPGAWHIKRQQATVDLLRQKPFSSLVDVGFGVPQQYVQKVVLKQEGVHCTLLDIYESAITFGQALVQYWDKSWQQKVTLKQHDMNSGKAVGQFDVYLLQDSIEHTKNPAAYLNSLVKQAPSHARFIFSLPINVGSEHEPSHFIGWSSDAEAKDWLEQSGLQVMSTTPIKPDVNVDIYARSLNKDYFQLIADCIKA